MRKLFAIPILFWGMLMATVPVTAAQSPIYQNESEALQHEVQNLRETVSQPGTYTITLRFYDSNGSVVEQEIFLEITADDVSATNTMSESYIANEQNGWFNNYNSEDSAAWTGFAAFLSDALPFILTVIMLAPFLILLLMSFLTSKLTRDVNSVLEDK